MTTSDAPEACCSDAARARQEPLHASALSNGRFLLLEVPGAWGRTALTECSLDAAIAAELATRAARAAARIELIRRPGRRGARREAAGRPLAWAIADTTAGAERIRWGSWRDPAELLELDLAADVTASGPQRVALVCANAKRDQCCARRGRPVAAALADATSWDTWECSHLGGHRFAANVLLLPSGEMFGRLDPDLAVKVLAAFDAGEILLSQHRGRCGQRTMVQAAMHAAALRLGDGRAGALRGVDSRHVPARTSAAADIWEVDVAHGDVLRGGQAHGDVPRGGQGGAEAVYRLTVVGTRTEPAFLSCADAEPKSELRYEAVAFARLR